VEGVPIPWRATVFVPPDVRSMLKDRVPKKVVAESGRKVT
jgi:hypothetical protein